MGCWRCGSGAVLVQGHVAHPVQTVFDDPETADPCGEVGGGGVGGLSEVACGAPNIGFRLTCGFPGARFGHAMTMYSLVSPSRIILR